MKNLLLLTIITVGAATVHARQLTPVEALSRATGLTPSRSNGTQLVYADQDDKTGVTGVYVFTRGEDNGFFIVSADDCAEALLGYSDSGTFDSDDIPDNMRAWLSGYTAQIAYASRNASPTAATTYDTRPYRAPLAPLCKTQWNQNSPYNDMCPTAPSGVRTPVGCAATAMAQVLKSHNWPKQGTGINTYTSKNLGIELSFDFGATAFDWDNMVDIYDSNATDAQKNAVATLSYACGVAANMNYALSGSAADVKTALKGMIEYMNIDKGASIQQRKWYTLNEWEDLIYTTLSEYGPVIYYGASSAQSAHEFVCDGYDKDGYFHINWGWGGLSDGYFLLDALTPDWLGIGGSEGGFNLWQNAIIDICPEKADSHYAQIISTASTLMGAGTGSTITLEGRFNNESVADLDDIVFGVKIGDEYFPGQTLTLLPEGYGISKYNVNLKGLPEGTYRAYPAFKTAVSDWQMMKGDNANVNYVDITVTPNGNVIVSSSSTTVSLDLTGLKVHSTLSPGCQFKLTATLINKGGQEFYDDIVVMLSGQGAPVEIARQRVDVLPGRSEDITIEPTLPADIKTGNYSLMIARVIDGKTSAIGMPIRVTIAMTGIDDVIVDNDVIAIDIYTLTGVRIPIRTDIKDVESLSSAELPSGIYILSMTHSDGHRSTIKYHKK